MKRVFTRLLTGVLLVSGFLLLAGGLVFWRDAHRESLRPALFRAIWRKDTAAVRSLLDRGADPNAKIHYQDYGLTWRELVIRLLRLPPPPASGIDGCCGTTALMEAVMKDDEATVRLLLERGADPKELSFDGFPASAVANDELGVPHNQRIAALLNGAAGSRR